MNTFSPSLTNSELLTLIDNLRFNIAWAYTHAEQVETYYGPVLEYTEDDRRELALCESEAKKRRI